MLDGAVVAFGMGGLLRLAGLGVQAGTPSLLGLLQQLDADVVGAVIHPYSAGFSPPFYDAIQAPDHLFGGQRKVDLVAQAAISAFNLAQVVPKLLHRTLPTNSLDRLHYEMRVIRYDRSGHRRVAFECANQPS